jgi:transposase
MAQSIEKSVAGLPLSGHPVSPLVQAVRKSLLSFSKQVQGLAICWKGSVARPLHASLQSLGETAPGIFARYSESRHKCFAARQAALKMRSRYVKAVREAEVAIQEFKDAKKAADVNGDAGAGKGEAASSDRAFTGSEPSSPAISRSNSSNALAVKNSWEQGVRRLGRIYGIQGTADRVISCLREVQNLEAQYVALVQEENTAVSQAETLEMMGLESIQHLEEVSLSDSPLCY